MSVVLDVVFLLGGIALKSLLPFALAGGLAAHGFAAGSPVGEVGLPCGGLRGNDNVEEQWFGRGIGFVVGSVRRVRGVLVSPGCEVEDALLLKPIRFRVVYDDL